MEEEDITGLMCRMPGKVKSISSRHYTLAFVQVRRLDELTASCHGTLGRIVREIDVVKKYDVWGKSVKSLIKSLNFLEVFFFFNQV